jgi:hypothetical protein
MNMILILCIVDLPWVLETQHCVKWKFPYSDIKVPNHFRQLKKPNIPHWVDAVYNSSSNNIGTLRIM